MKKILTITGVAALAVTLFFNVSLSREISVGDISLASLATVNQANAECNPITTQSMQLGDCINGYCFYGGSTCEYS